MTHTIGMISLGCAKNQVNAEHMLWLLRQAGYEISPDPDGAELVIVNTCGFIESAKTEAIDNILAMAQLKAEGRIQKILVTGCLAQRYQEPVLITMLRMPLDRFCLASVTSASTTSTPPSRKTAGFSQHRNIMLI